MAPYLALLGSALLASASPSGADERLLPPGTFLASDGTVRPFRETHDRGIRPLSHDPHYFRAALEDLGILVVGESYYWIRPEINKQDWDFPTGKQRLDNFRPSFDDNLHVTNDVLHPLGAGSLYYWAARENGLGIPLSLVYTASTSALFEFFGELLERASINDLIMTPMAGLSPGELWTHLSDYLNSAPNPRWGHDAAAWTFGIAHRVHRRSGDEDATRALPADDLGFSSYHWHRFQFALGGARLSNDLGREGFMSDFRADVEIVSIPGFLQPGRFVLPFHDGELTEGHFRMGLGEGGDQTWDLSFEAHLAGRYEQSIDRRRVGRALMISLASAYDFAERYRLGRYDAWTFAHLIGPALRLWAVDGDLVAHVEAAISPDFAVIQSQAWPEWKARFGDKGQKSELVLHGYYFAYGWSPRVRASIAWRNVEFGWRGLYGRYDSIDRGDRFQSDLTNNPHEFDRIVELEGWLSVRVPATPLQVRAYAMHTDHFSDMPPLTVHTVDRLYGTSLGVSF